MLEAQWLMEIMLLATPIEENLLMLLDMETMVGIRLNYQTDRSVIPQFIRMGLLYTVSLLIKQVVLQISLARPGWMVLNLVQKWC